jgi:hypothetical protein
LKETANNKISAITLVAFTEDVCSVVEWYEERAHVEVRQ